MNLGKLFSGPKKLDPEKLPILHSFVEVTVKGRPMKTVAVERIGSKEIVIGEVLGHAGDTAVFVYQNENGRFRTSTRVIAVKDGKTHFELPGRVDVIGGGTPQKRSTLRMDALVQGSWRYAPTGEGVGEFNKGSIRDISRGGCALIVDRQFRFKQMLQLRLHLRSDAPPLQVLAEVVRMEQIPTSGKFSHGLRFRSVPPEADQAIGDFINEKQRQLRSRGLA